MPSILISQSQLSVLPAAENSHITINFHRKYKYLGKKLTFQNSPKIKRSKFSQLKRKFLVLIS